MHTSTNAKSVPMFVSWTTSSMFATAAKNATKIPVRIVVTYGVRYFGWIFPNHGPRSPSRDIAMRMRGCPSWKTRRTDVIATTAPNARMPAAHPWFTYVSAAASGSATPSSFAYGIIPVSTRAAAR